MYVFFVFLMFVGLCLNNYLVNILYIIVWYFHSLWYIVTILLHYVTMFRWCQICGHDQSDPVCIHGSCPLEGLSYGIVRDRWVKSFLFFLRPLRVLSKFIPKPKRFAHENDLNVEWFWGSQQLFNSSFPTGGFKEASHHVRQPTGRC